MTDFKKDVVVIVEGWSDHDQIKGAMPDIEIIVTNGTRINNRIRDQMNYHFGRGDHIFILTDPDTAGDQLADMIREEFWLPRIVVDPEQAKYFTGKRYKYGIEYCSYSYLRELLGGLNDV